MSKPRQVYLLDPQKLPPETIAVTFAKTSRSPLSFQEIAAELSIEKSAEFHEKWVVGYGHSSVAEHAVLHIAVENISRLAVECLESNRLASYTEKSTRYQKWSRDSFYLPNELEGSPLKKLYLETNQLLFQTYQDSLPILQQEVAKHFPRGSDESEAGWERRIRAKYVDVARFLLPAASLANVGMTINARALEHALRKMLSNPLEEVRHLGEEIKAVSKESVPTLVKYAQAVPFWADCAVNFAEQNKPIIADRSTTDWCRLVQWDVDAELRVIAALLYRFGSADYDTIWRHLQSASPQELENYALLAVKNIKKFDTPLREFEYGNFTFDLLMDQGAYFEIKRHRIMTQSPQSLTATLGYMLPKMICDANFERPYHTAMEKAISNYAKIAQGNPDLASYVVPNAFNRRVLMLANYRSLDHLISLRSAENAHFSVRRLAHRMLEEISKVSPFARHWIRECSAETWQEVEAKYFCFNTDSTR